MATAKSGSQLMRVAPEDIRFTQETVPLHFDPPHAQRRLDEAVELIMSRRLSADDFPPMRVLLVKDQLWTLNNRRLWVFRKAIIPQVGVKLLGRFDDDTSNPFFGSYLCKLMSPQHFIPQVRGQCRSEFDLPSMWSHAHTQIRAPLQVPLTLRTRYRNSPMIRPSPSRSSSWTAKSSMEDPIDASVEPVRDPSSGPQRDTQDTEKKAPERFEMSRRRKSMTNFVKRRNYSRPADETRAGTAADVMNPIISEDKGRRPAGTRRCNSRMNTTEGKNSEVEVLTEQEPGTAPKIGGGPRLPNVKGHDLRTSNLQLLTSIEALLGPEKDELYDPSGQTLTMKQQQMTTGGKGDQVIRPPKGEVREEAARIHESQVEQDEQPCEIDPDSLDDDDVIEVN